MTDIVANFELNNESIDAQFDVSEVENFDALFEIYATGTTWGNISGEISNQTDLLNALNQKADKSTVNSEIATLNTTITENYNALNTSIQNEAVIRANNDTLLQNDINTLNDNLTAEITNRTSADDTLQDNIDDEITNRQNADTLLQDDINTINSKIPNQASSSNKLADKNFVNSSIATNTANFIGTFNSVAELEAYSGTLTNNDYAFVTGQDQLGNTYYDRYKWNGTQWLFEYELNNSSFTAEQWAAINSGITSGNVALINTALQPSDLNGYATETYVNNGLATKQNTLTAGDNIQIQNNVISATDTTYTAGTGINIENGVISNTQTSAEWGNIEGDISDQTDLIELLDGKQDLLTSENAGTDIEIVNGEGGDDTVSGNTSILLEKAVADGLNSVTVSGNLKRSLLPDGYTQYDYISVNGDCYFITDYYPSNITEVKTKTFVHKQPTSPLVTRWTGSPTNDTFGFYMGNVSGRLTVFYGRYSDTKYLNIENVKLNIEHDIYIGVNSITFDGTSYSITRDTFTSTQPIYIGAFNQTGSSLAGMMYGRIYPVEFIEGGRTVKHYIPCKNNNGVIGLYEVITGTFINSTGSGTAKKGRPTINLDTIPSEYSRLEFLQATGTQYIDSGVVANFANNKIEQTATVQYTTSNTSRELMGTNGYGFWGKNASNKIEAALGQVTVTDNALVKNVISWTTNPDGKTLTLNVNSNQYTSTASSFVDANYAYYVFALGIRVDSGAAASFLCHAKVWDYTMAVDDEVVCYLIPVKRNSDNVLGMYDVVTKTFKTNAGTGTFTAGSNAALPSPTNPIPIVCNNGQLKLGSHGKNLFNKDGSPYLAGAYISSATVSQSTFYTTSNANYNIYRIEIKPNTTYTFGLIKANDPKWVVTDGSVILDTGSNSGGNAGTYKTITTGATAKYLYLSVAVTGNYKCDDILQLEEGAEHTEYETFHYILVADGRTETITDSANNSATAEMLLSIGNYTDTQELLTGAVTRKVGVKVLDGTEDWGLYATNNGYRSFRVNNFLAAKTRAGVCTHLPYYDFSSANMDRECVAIGGNRITFYINLAGEERTVNDFKTWLAQQYAAGTPVTFIYPLATETTETVTGQTLTTITGDNTLTISQASIENLPIEANYNMQGGTVINFTNDSGYTKNVGTVTSVNNVQPDSNGNVAISIPDVSNFVTNTDLETTLQDYAETSDLAEVATSGSYNDLTNKPVIDTELSTTSTNAVQNSVITQALQNIDVDTLIPVTYAELVQLKTNSQLKAGAFYRVTDFVTTTNGASPNNNEPSRSAGHPFDLIIQALGESNLSDICTAALHENDTYFANNNLGSWQIWYDIDNSTSKYAWADSTNGKGVIYRLIDEFGNDLSFDFKNIQFYRDKTLAKYSTIASYLTSSDNYYYVFSKNTSGTVTDKSLNANTHDNIIGAYIGGSSNTRYLENTIFVHTANTVTDTNTIGTENYNNTCCGNFYGNSIDMLFYNNIIANNFYYNNIGAVFRDNKIGENFLKNTIVGVFYENTIDEFFYYNEIGFAFYGNTIGNYFYGNKTCSDFYNNTIPLNSHNNFFGTRFYNNTGSATTNGIQQSTFGTVVYNCTFGEKFQRNSIGNFAMNCVFGNNNAGITIGNNNAYLTFSNNVQSCVVFNRCGYVNVTIPMVMIYSKIVGSSNTNRFTTSGLPTAGAYNIIIKTDSNGAVLATYNDGANEIGYKKATVTTSAWSELLPTYTWEGS